jgi:hypothetical protein
MSFEELTNERLTRFAERIYMLEREVERLRNIEATNYEPKHDSIIPASSSRAGRLE